MKKIAIISGVVFGIFIILFLLLIMEIKQALWIGTLSGIVFALAIYFFVSSKKQ